MSETKEIEFKPCPDCGCKTELKDMDFSRERQYYSNQRDIVQSVSAYCPICGWATPHFPTVREVAEFWNGTEI